MGKTKNIASRDAESGDKAIGSTGHCHSKIRDTAVCSLPYITQSPEETAAEIFPKRCSSEVFPGNQN